MGGEMRHIENGGWERGTGGEFGVTNKEKQSVERECLQDLVREEETSLHGYLERDLNKIDLTVAIPHSNTLLYPIKTTEM